MTIVHEYETIYILKPELPEDSVRAVEEKLTGIIARFEGDLLQVDDWGKRKMAYNIKKNSRGHYVRLHYVGPAPLITELERNLRIDDRQIRFLTVRMSEDVDVELKRSEITALMASRVSEEVESEQG